MELKSKLETIHGLGYAEPATALDDCSDGIQGCYEKGRVTMGASWAWRNAQALHLTLSGGAPRGQPRLTVVYTARLPIDAPRLGPGGK